MSTESPVRAKLLELAIAVLDESGEVAIRTNHLAEEAGVKVPTLYHYFGSREGLIEEAQAERFSRQLREDGDSIAAALRSCKTEKDVRRALANLFASRDSDSGRDRRWQRMNAFGAAYARPELESRIAKVTNEVATQVSEALIPLRDDGIIRQDIDLRALVAWYIGSSLGKLVVEVEGSDIDVGNWEKLMNEANLSLMFPPAPR